MLRRLITTLLPLLILAVLFSACSSGSDLRARGEEADDDDGAPDDDDVGNDDDAGDDDDSTPPSSDQIIIHAPAQGQTIIGQSVYVKVEYLGSPENPAITLDETVITGELVFYANIFEGMINEVPEGEHLLIATATYGGTLENEGVSFTTTMTGNHGWIDLDLSASYIPEGGSVTASYTVYDGDGNDVTGLVTVTLSADPSTGVTIDGELLTFANAGTYEVIANAMIDEFPVTGSAYLVVGGASEVDHVQIDCSPNEIDAGQVVTCTGAAYDEDDNPLSTPIVYSVDPPNASPSIVGGEVTLTLAGQVTIIGTAAGTDISDSESVTVNPGPADDISLTLNPSEVLVDETSTAEVALVDEYGNPISSLEDVTITTQPSEGVTVDGMEITPHIAGQIIVTATVNQGGHVRQDQALLLVTEGYPPIINVTAPDRGEFITDTNNITVQGQVYDEHGAVATFQINGQDVYFDPVTGSFTRNVTLVYGLNTIIFFAQDDSGNETYATISVMYAPTYLENGVPVVKAFGAHVNPSGLNKLAVIAETFAQEAIDDLLNGMTWPMILFEETYDFWGIEYFWGKAWLNKPTLSPVDLNLTTQPGGIHLTAGVNNVTATGSLEYEVLGIPGSEDFTITVTGLSIGADLVVWINDGDLEATLTNVTISDYNINIDINGSLFGEALEWLLDLFGTQFINDIIDPLVVDTIMAVVPPLIRLALNQLELNFDFNIFDFEYHLYNAFSETTFSDQGGTLWLQSNLWYGDGSWNVGPNTPDLPGSIKTDTQPPGFGLYIPGTSTPYDFAVVIGDDILNQVLHVIHRSGFLSLDLDEETMEMFGITGFELTTGALGVFFPGLWAEYGMDQPVIIKMRPKLPPVFHVNPQKDKGLATEIQFGEFQLQFTTNDEVWAQIALALYIPTDVTISEDQTIDIAFGEFETYVDLFDIMDGIRANAGFFETFVPTLVDVLVPLLLGSILEEIPIPSFEGFTLEVNSFQKVGAGLDWMGLYGDLIYEPEAATGLPPWHGLDELLAPRVTRPVW
jgi:hypothetical protein